MESPVSKKSLIAATSLTRQTSRLELRPLALRDYRAWQYAHRTMGPPQSAFDSGPLPEEKLTYKCFREQLKNDRALREAAVSLRDASPRRDVGRAEERAPRTRAGR